MSLANMMFSLSLSQLACCIRSFVRSLAHALCIPVCASKNKECGGLITIYVIGSVLNYFIVPYLQY